MCPEKKRESGDKGICSSMLLHMLLLTRVLYIKGELDELEREEFFRLKRSQDKKKKDIAAKEQEKRDVAAAEEKSLLAASADADMIY